MVAAPAVCLCRAFGELGAHSPPMGRNAKGAPRASERVSANDCKLSARFVARSAGRAPPRKGEGRAPNEANQTGPTDTNSPKQPASELACQSERRPTLASGRLNGFAHTSARTKRSLTSFQRATGVQISTLGRSTIVVIARRRSGALHLSFALFSLLALLAICAPLLAPLGRAKLNPIRPSSAQLNLARPSSAPFRPTLSLLQLSRGLRAPSCHKQI